MKMFLLLPLAFAAAVTLTPSVTDACFFCRWCGYRMAPQPVQKSVAVEEAPVKETPVEQAQGEDTDDGYRRFSYEPAAPAQPSYVPQERSLNSAGLRGTQSTRGWRTGTFGGNRMNSAGSRTGGTRYGFGGYGSGGMNSAGTR